MFCFIASIWTLRLFNRGCDICKDYRIEILVIYCSNMQSGLVTCSLEISKLGTDPICEISITYLKLTYS